MCIIEFGNEVIIMWKLLFVVMLYVGCQFILTQWYNEKNPTLLKMNIMTSLCFIVLSVLNNSFIHLPYIIISILSYGCFLTLGIFYHYQLDALFVPLIFSLSVQMIQMPIQTISLSYIQTWQYASYTLFCLLSLFYVVVESSYLKMKNEWFRQLSMSQISYQKDMILIPLLVSIMVFMLIWIMPFDNLLQGFMIILICCFLILFTMKILQLWLHLKYTLLVIDTMNIWQKESRDYMNVIRSQRHDFNFHLHAVVGLIENGEFEECRHYVANMANEASMINDIMPIHDSVIGSMLYNMKENAKKKGIEIEYNITYDLEHVLCNAFEINKILGNLIQNAIDAISTEQEKEYGIKVSILKRRGNSVIIVSNCFEGDKDLILHAYDLGFSTKKHHEGIGLSMIARTVEKYGGRIYTEIDENIVSFIVNIPNYVHFD